MQATLSRVARSFVAYQRLIANVERRLLAASRPSAQRRILITLLERPGSTDAQLADYLGMERAFLSRNNGTLIDDGLLLISPSKRHRSQRALCLSDLGVAVATKQLEALESALYEEVTRLEGDDRIDILSVIRLEGAPARDSSPIEVRCSTARDLSWLMGELADVSQQHGRGRLIVRATRAIARSYSRWPAVELRWTATQFGIPIGICILSVSDDDVDLELAGLFVSPKFRYQGAASQLLKAAEAVARTHRYSSFKALFETSDTALVSLLRKLNFQFPRGSVELCRDGEKILQHQAHKSLPPW